MNKKIVIVVIGIVIIVAGMAAAGIYINNKQSRPELPDLPPQPKPGDISQIIPPDDQNISIDKETSWQIYHNKDYKFEVKFPGDWIIEIYKLHIEFGFKPKTEPPYGNLINLYIEPGSLEKELKELDQGGNWETEQEKPRANGINIVKIYTTDIPWRYGYIFENQGLVFTFLGGGENTEITDIFERMMDSFRFIE